MWVGSFDQTLRGVSMEACHCPLGAATAGASWLPDSRAVCVTCVRSGTQGN